MQKNCLSSQQTCHDIDTLAIVFFCIVYDLFNAKGRHTTHCYNILPPWLLLVSHRTRPDCIYHWTSEARFTLRSRHFKAQLSVSRVRPTGNWAFQTLNWTLFKPEEFENSGFLFSSGRETFWKRSFFENDGVTMIKSFPCQSFPQTQNQNGRCVLRFQIPPGKCEWGLKCILHKETQTDKKWAKFWSYEGLNKKGF